MRIKKIISLVITLSIGIAATAQSLYTLTYRLQKDTVANAYNAFLILNNDGTVTVRIKNTIPGNAAPVVEEMKGEEQYTDAKVEIANNKLLYRLSAPTLLRGNGKLNYEPAFLVFKKSAGNNEYEPWGVSGAGNDTNIHIFSSIIFLENKSLNKELVLEYFSRQDIFYKNLFETGTRALSPFEKSTKLILLAVANINDPEIGPSCLKDMNRIVETFTKLADFMGIQFVAKTVSGKEYNKQNVDQQLNALTPKSNDIVIFYYSGHGFRKPKDGRQFPYLDLRAKLDKTYMVNSINIEDVYTNIRSKGARLNLVISDCCNTDVEKLNSVGTPIPAKKGFSMTWNLENCRALFLNPLPRSILMSAADRGQKAASNNDFGGFFSFFLKSSIEDQLGFLKNNVSWENILNDTKKNTIKKAEHTYCDSPYIPANICEQYPIWK